MTDYALHANTDTEHNIPIDDTTNILISPTLPNPRLEQQSIRPAGRIGSTVAPTIPISVVSEMPQTSDETSESNRVNNNTSCISVLLCGSSDIQTQSVAGQFVINDKLGRRKLRSPDLEIGKHAEANDVFWLAPKRYWTVSKGSRCLQDISLDIVDCFLSLNKDIVIVTPSDFRWVSETFKNASKCFHQYHTPGHVVLCTRKLDNLCALVGPSSSEILLNVAIASCLSSSFNSVTPEDRLGVRQSYHGNSKSAPSSEQPKTVIRRTKHGSKSQEPAKKVKGKVKFEQADEYDLGDHATNDDKSTAKPNYAKQHNQEKQKAKKTCEQHKDDCGDAVDAIEIEDTEAFPAFLDDVDQSTTCPDSDSDSYGTFDTEELDGVTKVYLNSMDELNAFAGIKQPDSLDLMEIFGGHAGVTRLAVRRRNLAVGQNFDVVVGIDLLKKDECQKLLDYIDQHAPKVIVLGPPCTAFGPWARYNKIFAFDAWSRSYAIGLPLALLAAKIAKIQMDSGRFFLCENPWASELWNLPAWQAILVRCFVAYCEQCVFGLTDADNQPTLKPTAFVSNCEDLITNLRQECNGRHEYHAPLAGTLYGISKTAYAQQWPPKLCRTIVKAIEHVCKFHNAAMKQAYPEVVTAKCPGCKSHAYSRDPRHTRVRGECKFPDVQSDVLKCSACLRNLPSHHPQHTKVPNECHWAEALPRLGGIHRASTASSSQGPQPVRHVVPDANPEVNSGIQPPITGHGRWYPVTDLSLISAFEDIKHADGWNSWNPYNWDENYDQALVSSNTRYLREPQPRYDNSTYNTRSTYGQFLEHEHEAGIWWQLEDHVEYANKDRSIGYPVSILIHVFHRNADPGSSPTEKESIEQQPALSRIGEATSSDQPMRRRTVEPVEIAEPVEYGEDEPEMPEVPIRRPPVEESESREGAIVPVVEEQPEQIVEWSTADLGNTLRELRTLDRGLITRALRKLHVRWWHAQATRMKQILSQVGLPESVLSQVKDVCDTCRICRAWAKPTSKAMSHLTQAQNFNERVQIDLLFVGSWTITHMIDEATRFSMAEIAKSREPAEILSTIKRGWIKIFKAPQLFISDSEGALGSEEASIWAERLGTSFKLLPKGSHATMVERHHQTLRDLLHRIMAQLKVENLTMNMEDVLAEAVAAKNSLLVINGVTPYTAVFGRTPNLLGEFEKPSVSMIADSVGGEASKHASRLREISVQQMVEGTARERIQRAQKTQTRVTAEQLELVVGDLVDIYRTPRQKDNVGWRGPAKVVSISSQDQGIISVQWGGRIMNCRTQDTRKALMYPAMLQGRSDDAAFDLVRQYVSQLVNTCETFGMTYTANGWQLSQAARKSPSMFYALLRVAHDMFQMPRCVAGRVGRGVANTNGLFGAEQSILVWWPSHNPQLYKSMSCLASSNLNLKELFGENWQDCCWIRCFGVDNENVETIRRLAPDIPYLGGEPGDPQVPPDAAAVPVPMDEDDVTIRDDRSTSTRIITPMSTDHGAPPAPPPSRLQQRQRTAAPSERSRSRQGSSTSSNQPISTITTASPVNTTSNRATTGTDTLRQLQSPRGDKRAPTKSGTSDQHLNHTHKHHRDNSTAASSSSTAPAQNTNIHEPLLPTHDEHDDDDNDDDATIAQDSETEALVVEQWSSMFVSGQPPPQYHTWEIAPGAEEVIESQHQYLLHCTLAHGNFATRSDTSANDVFEIEIGPAMSAWFVDAPKVAVDEILVFKATSEVSSAQIEKNFDALTPQEIKQHYKLVEEAIRKEISSFVEHKTFMRALRKDCSNVCTSRWVLRWKEIDGKRCVKARLTIRGFQDLADVASYASTACRWSQRLVVSIAVQKGWQLWVTDISTAFLQGMSFEELARLTGTEARDVAFTPPRGSERFFIELKGMHDLNFSTEVFKLLKAAYGLRDAPRAWRIRLDLELRKLGGIPLPTDKAIYCFYDNSQNLEAIVSTHVDDLKGGGVEHRAKSILKGLEASFGKLKTQHDSFLHCGLMHEKTKDGYVVHQDHYAAQLRCVDVSSLDISKLDQLLDEKFISAYQSLLGGLSWLVQTRLDVAVYVCALQRAAKKATTGHLLKLNKLTKWVRRKKYKLTYCKLTQPCKLMVISDSAFRSEPDSALAIRGAILGICELREGNVGGKLHVLEYYSRKQRRVCRSTFAAELNAIADALEIARLINLTVACCHKPFKSYQQLQALEDEGNMPLAVEVVTDCRSVFDALANEDTKTPSESSLVLILHAVKELMQSHVLRYLTWVHTDDMLADGLTKGGVSRKALFRLSETGIWQLKHESKTHAEKRKQTFMTVFWHNLMTLLH